MTKSWPMPALLLLLLMVRSTPGSEETAKSAWREVGYLNYRGASIRFEKLRQRAEPRSEAWIGATMGLAVSLHHRQPDVKGDKDRAADLYETVIEATDGNPLQPLALLLRARVADQTDYHGDVPDAEQARKLYDRLLKDWPDSPYIHQAAMYRAQLFINSMEADQVRQGIADTGAWLKKYPDNHLAAMQWMLIALAYTYPLKEPGEAVDAYLRAERVGLPRHVKRDSYYWKLGNLAEQAGRKEIAATYYRRIITEVQRTGFAYEAQLRLRALGEEPPPLVNPFASDAEEKGGAEK